MIAKDVDGNLIIKTGIMTTVLEGGIVKPSDRIDVVLPQSPHQKLEII